MDKKKDRKVQDLTFNCKPGETYKSPPLEVTCDDLSVSVDNSAFTHALKWVDNAMKMMGRDNTLPGRVVTTRDFNPKDDKK